MDGYMRLPTDADGVPVRVGDRMVLDGGTVVTAMAVSEVMFVYTDDEGMAWWTGAGNKRHYDRLTELEAEHRRLREISQEYAEIANHLCEAYNACADEYRVCEYDPITGRPCRLGQLNELARGFGIEVDE